MMRLFVILLAALATALPAGAASRIKDIASLQSSRDNLLVGYGLVVGLQGTGDGLRNSPFTEQSMKAMLSSLGIATGDRKARSKNLAAVIVTARLPVFARPGTRIDVTVSSIGDAASLSGGTLVMTPLRAPDGEIYGAAQGPVIVSGFQAQGEAETITRGVPTTGRIPSGAIVERAIPAHFGNQNILTLQLRNPDFSTAVALTDAINAAVAQRLGVRPAREQDAATVQLHKPEGISAARFIALIENIRVRTDTAARVVMDETTGTVVIGRDVQISKVAVSHGTLSVRVTEAPRIVQPEPFSDGVTAVEPNTQVATNEPGGQVATVRGTSLQELVGGLNQLGVKPTDIIAILQAIKSAGALQAELVLQ